MLFMFLHGVVIHLPVFQLLEDQETLGQVRLILSGTVDAAGRGHLFWGAGAALQKGPILKHSQAVVLEAGFPGLRKLQGARFTITPPLLLF